MGRPLDTLRFGLALACLLAAPVAAQTPLPEGYASVTPQQARQLGLEAIRMGRPDLAARIASDLLAIDQTDSFAHFLMAHALMRLDRADMAEEAAKEAFRQSKSPEESYQSAHLVADLAHRRGALTTAQWWLRKSAEVVPDQARKNRTIAEFRAVKARNPWRIKLGFSLRPSDNVNNGSSGQFNIIDGLPFVGALSQDAQAVKGVVGDAAVSLGYRLAQSDTAETTLGLDLSLRHVRLDGAEKARLGGDPGFGSNRVAVSLRQDWQKGGSPHRFSVEGTIGRQSYQAGRGYGFAVLSFGHRMPLAAMTVLDSALDVEQRSKQGKRGDRSFAIRSTVIHQRDNADLVSITALANRFDTEAVGRSGTTFGLQLGYTLAKPVGPVGVGATLGLQKKPVQRIYAGQLCSARGAIRYNRLCRSAVAIQRDKLCRFCAPIASAPPAHAIQRQPVRGK